MNPARVGKLSGESNVAVEVDLLDVSRCIKPLDFGQRNSLKTLFAFWMFGERRLESLLLPTDSLYLDR